MKPGLPFIFILLASWFTAMVVSCKTHTNTAPQQVVYYYPEKNVYYDSQLSNYYYSLNGGLSWDSMAFAGPGYGRVLGKNIALKKTDTSVWIDNERHRKQYNGVILNIINNQTISLSRADSINKAKIILHAQTRKEAVKKEVPQKKGLKKFFNKLFGKKKTTTAEKKQ